MGAIQRFKAWWQRIVVDDLEDWDGEPSAEEARNEAKALKKLRAELHIWIVTTFDFLGADVAEKLFRRVRRETGGGDDQSIEPSSALRDGLLGDFFKGGRAPFIFIFEARYTEDAEKILGKVCGSYGISDRFQHDETTQGAIPSLVLRKFKDWLVERSFDLIIFDTGSDEYCGFLIPLDALENVISGLRAMGVKATNIPEDC